MKPAIYGACMAVGVAIAASGGASAQTPVQIECKQQLSVLPSKGVEITWEDRGMCSAHANATKKAVEGKKLSDKETERVKLVAWLDGNMDAGDRLTVDRFGRATLIRCSTDPNVQMMPKPAPKIGDGTYELYLLLELPPGAAHCGKPS